MGDEAMSLTLDEILDEVARAADIPEPRQEGEFTCREFAARRGLTWKVASRILAGLVDSEIISQRKVSGIFLYKKVRW